MNAHTDTSPIEAHWQTRAARPWFSIADADAAASRVLGLCGMGTLLDVGCGNGTLMRALRLHGVDVHGIDRSPSAVALCNAQAPGSATLGDALALPFEDGSFDTAVCCGLPDLLTEEDLHTLMAQLRRVARHGVVLVCTAPRTWSDIGLKAADPDRARRTFDHAAFEAGLRRHPLAMRDVSFAALEIDADPRFMAYEPIPPAAAEFSARWLRERRDLHADHLRGTGRRADAHLARYTLACDHIRNADRVLDVACGMGYGARMLATASPAANVLGIDASLEAVAYSHANYGSSRVRFACDDAEKLTSLEGEQFDFITCFETLEHLPDPLALIERAHTLLSPGGRMLVSVPNDWADETGKDPNPHHFHVYTRQRLVKEMGEHFIIERTWRQSAGGGWKHSAAPRAITPAGDATDDAPAEWWLMLVMKSPLGAPKDSGDERLFPPQPADPAYNLYQFARDYDNPALFRSIICIGPRLSEPVELTHLSEQVLAAARPGSADHGAAACVLAYQALHAPTAQTCRQALERIDTFALVQDGTPHAQRWVISGQYVAAKLLLALGDRQGALERFRSCAAMDALVFSPLLGTKTIDAARWVGVLEAMNGRLDRARAAWTQGIREARRLVTAPWLNVVGDDADPQPFGLHELSQVIDAASHCAGWIDASRRLEDQPGLAWKLARMQTFGDTRQYVQDLLSANKWLEGQVRAALGAGGGDISEVERLATAVRSLEEARSWLSGQVTNYQTAAAKAAADFESVRRWGGEVEEGKKWAESQLAASIERERAQAAVIEELRSHIGQLDEGKKWLESQLSAAIQREPAHVSVIDELRAHIAQLDEGKGWLAGQLKLASDREQELARRCERLEQDAAAHFTSAERVRQQVEELQHAAAAQARRVQELEREVGEQRSAAILANARADELNARGIWARLLNRGIK